MDGLDGLRLRALYVYRMNDERCTYCTWTEDDLLGHSQTPKIKKKLQFIHQMSNVKNIYRRRRKLRVRIRGAGGRSALDGVICSSELFSFQMCLKSGGDIRFVTGETQSSSQLMP